MDQIIKQLVFKFRTEGADQVKKVADSISKAFSPREVDRFLQSMEKVQKMMRSTGSSLSKELKIVNDYFKELNDKHIQRAEKNLDRLARLMKRQVEDIERLKRVGASDQEIADREATLKRTVKRFEQLSDETPFQSRGLLNRIGGPGRLGSFAGAAKLVGGAATTIAGMAGFFNQYQQTSMSNRVFVANVLKEYMLDAFGGDMSRAVLYSDPERAKNIKADAAKLKTSKDVQELSKLIGGAALGVGGIAALLMGGVPLLLGGATLGALGTTALGAGSLYAAKGFLSDSIGYFLGGGKQRYAMEAKHLAEEKARSQTMDVELYRQFAQKAPSRYEYQRRLMLSDLDLLTRRKEFLEAGVLDEQQMAQTMLSFRRFGARQAQVRASEALGLSRQLGMGLDTASQLMQAISTINRGGPSSAKQDLQDIFSKAVAAGIDDSGLIEEYQKAVIQMMNVLGAQMSASAAASGLNRFMAGSELRNIGAAARAVSEYGAVLHGKSPLMQAKRSARILDLARGKGGAVNMALYETLSQLAPEELAMFDENHPIAKEFGLGKEEVDKFHRGLLYDQLTSSLSAKEGIEVLEKAKRGETLSVRDQIELLAAMGVRGAHRMTDEERLSSVKAILQRMAPEAKPWLKSSEGRMYQFDSAKSLSPEQVGALQDKFEGDVKAATEGTAAGKQVKAVAAGQQELEQRIYDNVVKMMDNISSMHKEFVSRAFEEGSTSLSKSIDNVSEAVDHLASVLINAADRIEQSGLGAYSRGAPKAPGSGR